MKEPIRRIKLFEDVANRIIDRIQSEVWTVGERIPSEDQLASDFDVSRSTVREAIHMLQSDGILRSRPGSGTFVSENAPLLLGARELATITNQPERLHELLQTRYLLEPQLAAMAALRATDNERKALITTIETMEGYSDRQSLMNIGHSFHLQLSKMAHHFVLGNFYQSVANQLKVMRILELLPLETYIEDIRMHRAIADAVVDGDADVARRLMQEHLLQDYGEYLTDWLYNN